MKLTDPPHESSTEEAADWGKSVAPEVDRAELARWHRVRLSENTSVEDAAALP